MSMLTLVPFDDFIALESETLEGTRNFDWDDFLEASENIDTLNSYMDASGCKVLGEGSVRTVYALKSGDVDAEYVKGPCALKVALNTTAGAAQNKQEAELLNKYQHEREFFPRLYAYDDQDWFYLLMELGSPLDNASDSFTGKQFKALDQFFANYLKSDPLPIGDGHGLLAQSEFHLGNDCWAFETMMDDLLTIISLKEYSHERGMPTPEEGAWVPGLIDAMCSNSNPFVRTIGDVLKYAQTHGNSEICIGDLGNAANWAFVKRDGSYLLIPIDWGLNDEIYDKYYKKVDENTRLTLSIGQLRKLIDEVRK